jgi:hypothetical protein
MAGMAGTTPVPSLSWRQQLRRLLDAKLKLILKLLKLTLKLLLTL